MSDHKPSGAPSMSRKNSLTSLSTVNTNASAGPSMLGASPTARSLSTDNLLTLDNKFIKKTIKKVPNNVQPNASPVLASTDGFHKTNGGTYYFPNGEIFRPRLTPLKRNRPSKVAPSPQPNSRSNSLNTSSSVPSAPHQIHNSPMPTPVSGPSSSSTSSHSSFSVNSNSNSGSQDSVIPRNSSLQSLHALPNPSLNSINPVTGLQKSNSYNNIKQLNKQTLVKNLRTNKLDTPTNISLNNSDASYSRSTSMLSNVSSPFNSGSRQNSLTSHHNHNYNNNITNNNSSTNLRYNYPQSGFNPHNQNPPQLQKLQSNNILKASDANASLSSFTDYATSESASPSNGSDQKGDDQVLSQTESAGSNFSAASNSSNSSAYSSSSTASVSVTTTDPSSVTSHANLNRSMSNTPTTSIDDAKLTNASGHFTGTNSNPTTPEKNITFKDIKDIKKHFESPIPKGPNLGEALEDASGKRSTVQPPAEPPVEEATTESSRETEEGDYDGNLSTLNEVSEENLSKTTTNGNDYKLHHPETTHGTSRVTPPALVVSSKMESEDDLVYSTPVTSPTVVNAPTIPTVESVSQMNENEEQFSTNPELDENHAFKKHERNESVLPDPTIADDSYDRMNSVNEDSVVHQNNNVSTPVKDVFNADSFHDATSSTVVKPTTPQNSKFFDFHTDDKFNKFLNDDQVEVPPRGDLVVLSDQKIRKHDRASSSISSFNSIINNELESPRSPNRVVTSSPPLTPGQFSRGQLFNQSPKRPSSPLQKVDGISPSSPLPASTPTAFSHGAHDDLRPPTAFKEHDNLSAQSSLHLYSIHEGSKTSIASNNQKRSMLDVAGVRNEIKSTKPSALAVGSNSAGSASEPRLESPQKALKSKAKSKSMSNLSPNKPKSNLKSFFKKMFSSSKSPKVSTSGYNTTQDTDYDTEVESRNVNTSSILDSKSVKSASYYSITGSYKDSSTDAKSQHSTHSNKYKRSFSLGNLKKTKLGSKFTEKKPAPVLETQQETGPLRLTPRPDSVFLEPVLTELPSIEREESMFEDVMLTFDEKLTESERFENPSTHNILGSRSSVKDPFLKDDELTSAQIKDQQLRDGLNDDDNLGSIEPAPAFAKQGRPMSEEIYIDDNIRFLQSEFIWSNIDDTDLSKMEESSTSAPISYPMPEPAGEGPIVVTNDQLSYLFNNLTEYQRRSLPGHLKYIKQFKDYKFVEVDLKNFEDLENVERTTEVSNPSTSILKRGGDSGANSKKVLFSNKISINETFAPDMYKRYNKSVTQYTLTESFEINNIKNELNNYKCNEMLVHENSQNNTHFFY